MNLNRRIYMVVAFNAIVLLAMISVLTMQPAKKEIQLLPPEQSPQQQPKKVDDRSSKSAKKKAEKSRSKRIFYNEQRASYDFTIHAVVPIVTCGNFTEEAKKPTSEQDLIREIAGSVRTSLIFDFSPLVDDHVRKMFASNVLGEPWFEIHPFQVACLPDKEGGLLCALRIWLRMDRFQGHTSSNFVQNRFQDSFMYVMKLDKHLEYVPGSGDLLGIPTPIQDTAFTGPEDPRIFSVNGSTYVNFVMAHSYENVNYAVRRQFLWNIEENVLFDVQINRFVLNELEKNWTPWIINGTLHFVYQFTPVLRVMRCRVQPPPMRFAECSFIIGQPPYGVVSATHGMLLRGGSPFVSYTVPNYYIAVTHSVQGYAGARLYATQLVLLNGALMRIVLISSPIFIDPEKMKRIDNLAGSTVRLPFIYVRSVMVENADSLIVALGVNDNLCFLVRIEGIAALLREAIEQDEKLSAISQSLSCNQQETEQHREKWLAEVYDQMNDWLRKKNVIESERHFFSPVISDTDVTLTTTSS